MNLFIFKIECTEEKKIIDAELIILKRSFSYFKREKIGEQPLTMAV